MDIVNNCTLIFFFQIFWCDECYCLAYYLANDFSFQKILLKAFKEQSAFKKKHLTNFFYRSLPSSHDTWSWDEKTKLPSIHVAFGRGYEKIYASSGSEISGGHLLSPIPAEAPWRITGDIPGDHPRRGGGAAAVCCSNFGWSCACPSLTNRCSLLHSLHLSSRYSLRSHFSIHRSSPTLRVAIAMTRSVSLLRFLCRCRS